MEKVFENDFKSVQFILRHPDFLEGVRARIIEKDNQPRWKPDSLGKVDVSELQTLMRVRMVLVPPIAGTLCSPNTVRNWRSGSSDK